MPNKRKFNITLNISNLKRNINHSMPFHKFAYLTLYIVVILSYNNFVFYFLIIFYYIENVNILICCFLNTYLAIFNTIFNL